MPRAARPLIRVGMLGRAAATSVNTFVPRRMAWLSRPCERYAAAKAGTVGRSTSNSSFGFRTASTRKKNALKNVKATVMTPRPSAMVDTTVTATSGARRNMRSAKLMSRASVSKKDTPLVAALVSGEGTEPKRASARWRASAALTPAARSFPRFTLDVEGEFVVEVALDLAGREECADAACRIGELHVSGEFHDALDRRRHRGPCARSTASCAPSRRGEAVTFARRPNSDTRHSASIHPWCSSRCSAG